MHTKTSLAKVVHRTLDGLMRKQAKQSNRLLIARMWAVLMISVFSLAQLQFSVPSAMAHSGMSSHNHTNMTMDAMPEHTECLVGKKSGLDENKDICSFICDSVCTSQAIVWPECYASHQMVANDNFAALRKRAVLPSHPTVEERPPRII